MDGADFSIFDRYPPKVICSSPDGVIVYDHKVPIVVDDIESKEYALRSMLIDTEAQKLIGEVRALWDKIRSRTRERIKKLIPILPEPPKVEIPKLVRIPEFRVVRVYPSLSEEDERKVARLYDEVKGTIEPFTNYLSQLRKVAGQVIESRDPIDFAGKVTKDVVGSGTENSLSLVGESIGDVIDFALKSFDKVLPKSSSAEVKLKYCALIDSYSLGFKPYCVIVQTNESFIMSAGPDSLVAEVALNQIEQGRFGEILKGIAPKNGGKLAYSKYGKLMKIATTYLG